MEKTRTTNPAIVTGLAISNLLVARVQMIARLDKSLIDS